jgi:1-acyl-sn-glycerol-3-phosphate acyltransferase
MFRRLRALLITDPLILIATAAMGTLSLVVSFWDDNGRRQHKVAQLWGRMLVSLSRIRLEVDGLERLQPGETYVFASNHRSLMDIPVSLAAIPLPFRFLANDYLWRWPFVGMHLRRAGHFPVAPANARESLKSMSAAARTIARSGVSILLFPEGGRTHGEMKPFRDGAAYIAIKAGVPLVPVAMIGMQEILPLGSGYVTGGPVKVRIGDPISTGGLGLHDREALTRQLFGAVTELLGDGRDAAVPVHGTTADQSG